MDKSRVDVERVLAQSHRWYLLKLLRRFDHASCKFYGFVCLVWQSSWTNIREWRDWFEWWHQAARVDTLQVHISEAPQWGIGYVPEYNLRAPACKKP